MVSEPELYILQSLCEALSVPYEFNRRRNRAEHPWNGKSLNLAHSNPSGTSDMVHDIAHWLCATSDRRKDPYFKLNPVKALLDPNYESKCDAEEAAASLLGIMIERRLGLNWRYTLEFHNWATPNGSPRRMRQMRGALMWLRERGLIAGIAPACLR